MTNLTRLTLRARGERALAQTAKLAVVFFCKAALLAALLPFTPEIAEKVEEEGKVEVECLWLREGDGTRRLPQTPLRSSSGLLRVTHRARVAIERNTYSPQSDGHLLANGLRAPLVC